MVSLSSWVISSGFPSTRINLSPFTKDFRGGEHLNASVDNFLSPCLVAGLQASDRGIFHNVSGGRASSCPTNPPRRGASETNAGIIVHLRYYFPRIVILAIRRDVFYRSAW